MSIVAMLQGTPETDTLTTRSALAIAKRLNLPLTGLCALPDPQSAIMVVSTPEAAGMSGAAVTSILELQKEVLAKSEAAFKDVVSTGAHGLECTFVRQVGTAEQASASAATLSEALVFPRSAAKVAEPLSVAFDHVMMDARLPVRCAARHHGGRASCLPAGSGCGGSHGAESARVRSAPFRRPRV